MNDIFFLTLLAMVKYHNVALWFLILLTIIKYKIFHVILIVVISFLSFEVILGAHSWLLFNCRSWSTPIIWAYTDSCTMATNSIRATSSGYFSMSIIKGVTSSYNTTLNLNFVLETFIIFRNTKVLVSCASYACINLLAIHLWLSRILVFRGISLRTNNNFWSINIWILSTR